MNHTYHAFIFDYDGTLALTRQPLSESVVTLLENIFRQGAYIDIITGSEINKVESNIQKVFEVAEFRERLFLQPTTGAAMYAYAETGERKELYKHSLSEKEVQNITTILEEVLTEYSEWFSGEPTNPRIQNRGTEITFSALGSDAPVEAKLAWDPDGKKRDQLVSFLRPKLLDFEVVRGGTTSIDVTKKGIDKAFGIERFLEYVHLTPKEALFVGDALMPGGTDYTAIKTGVDTLAVEGPEDFLKKMESYVDIA